MHGFVFAVAMKVDRIKYCMPTLFHLFYLHCIIPLSPGPTDQGLPHMHVASHDPRDHCQIQFLHHFSEGDQQLL